MAETSMPEAQEENKADVEVSEEPGSGNSSPIELETAETAEQQRQRQCFPWKRLPIRQKKALTKKFSLC